MEDKNKRRGAGVRHRKSRLRVRTICCFSAPFHPLPVRLDEKVGMWVRPVLLLNLRMCHCTLGVRRLLHHRLGDGLPTGGRRPVRTLGLRRRRVCRVGNDSYLIRRRVTLPHAICLRTGDFPVGRLVVHSLDPGSRNGRSRGGRGRIRPGLGIREVLFGVGSLNWETVSRLLGRMAGWWSDVVRQYLAHGHRNRECLARPEAKDYRAVPALWVCNGAKVVFAEKP